mmetsp:Transcript_28510/g.43650  ORF Transcript_28510/g.43650 Transcript_28510/m.43650 type:complete len:96 (-) Transcript_28510:337-624(-)
MQSTANGFNFNNTKISKVKEMEGQVGDQIDTRMGDTSGTHIRPKIRRKRPKVSAPSPSPSPSPTDFKAPLTACPRLFTQSSAICSAQPGLGWWVG